MKTFLTILVMIISFAAMSQTERVKMAGTDVISIKPEAYKWKKLKFPALIEFPSDLKDTARIVAVEEAFVDAKLTKDAIVFIPQITNPTESQIQQIIAQVKTDPRVDTSNVIAIKEISTKASFYDYNIYEPDADGGRFCLSIKTAKEIDKVEVTGNFVTITYKDGSIKTFKNE